MSNMSTNVKLCQVCQQMSSEVNLSNKTTTYESLVQTKTKLKRIKSKNIEYLPDENCTQSNGSLPRNQDVQAE